MMKKIRSRAFIVVAVIALVLSTTYFAFGDYYRDLSHQLKIFNDLYKELVVNYVDEINPDALMKAGIDGMLDKLDPYTVYLEREQQHSLRTLTKGEYGGVGIQIGVRNDTLTVIAPMEGTPAARAGIQAGDQIIQIDTLNTGSLRLSKAAEIMRGKPGSQVTLTIIRPGVEERIPFALTREVIKIHDIALAEFIEDGIAYIKLNSFSKNSSTELKKAIESLGPQNIHGLIFDLRDNPGGLLTEALDIVDLFVPKGEKVLSTKGRTEKSNQTFYTHDDPIISTDVPMTVLVNGGSASASEIVTGVLQDLDRAVVVGHATFGKGLVQTVVPISNDAAIKITTAKYYIPSGRLIQKQDYFDNDIVEDYAQTDTLFYTQNHRRVYGGGGITPDVTVKSDTMNRVARDIWRKNYLFQYAVDYHNAHQEEKWPFQVTDSDYDSFISYVQMQGYEYHSSTDKLFKQFLSKIDSTALTRPELQSAKQTFHDYLAQEDRWDENAVQYWLTRGLDLEFASLYGGNKARVRESLKYDHGFKAAENILRDQSDYYQQLGYAPTGPDNKE